MYNKKTSTENKAEQPNTSNKIEISNKSETNNDTNQPQTQNNTEKDKLYTMKFEGKQLNKFENYYKLLNELDRCNQANAIQSAYINHKNILIVKTDKESENKLLNEWPTNAFLLNLLNK